MWNIRNRVEDHRGREGKLNGKKSEGETNHERLWTLETKLWREPTCPSTDEWIEMWCVGVWVCVYTQHRILLSHQKE